MFSPIRILKPGETHQIICTRVCRLWRNTDFKTEKLISLDCLLVDKQVTQFISYKYHTTNKIHLKLLFSI